MKRYITFLLLLFTILPIKAINVDSLQVSLLTVMPRPNQVYTIYGHSALRISCPREKIDVVYNWGIFDFGNPIVFSYHFLGGKTDYFVGIDSYNHFMYVYSLGNATVEEQILNLSAEEKEELLNILSINMLPENIVYQYSFLFDNCTTRIRDILEKSTGNKLIYPKQQEEVTFRDLIHSCTEPYPWMSFGIDLLIGNGADSLINLRNEMFLPLKLKEALDETYIQNQPIVISSKTVLKSEPSKLKSSSIFDSPLIVGFIILSFYILIAVFGIKKKRMFKGAFSPLFLVVGLGGIIVAFLVFKSELPSVSPNWNLLWVQPLHLFAFIGYFFKKMKSAITLYHGLNLLLLCSLLIAWNWIPQLLNVANIPYILCLALASGFWLFQIKTEKVNE